MRMFSWDDPIHSDQAEGSEGDAAWWAEKSKNELSELLLKADNLIKKRENGNSQ